MGLLVADLGTAAELPGKQMCRVARKTDVWVAGKTDVRGGRENRCAGWRQPPSGEAYMTISRPKQNFRENKCAGWQGKQMCGWQGKQMCGVAGKTDVRGGRENRCAGWRQPPSGEAYMTISRPKLHAAARYAAARRYMSGAADELTAKPGVFALGLERNGIHDALEKVLQTL
ncbi:hypothetical protein Bbelb_363950 [Branchiostoma belcheri]|nr:hypothetical protein Bbelb_363950 [Branchiostoma belcheri]